MILAHPSEDPDVQEALSIRYVVGLRLLLLSSGNWAIFSHWDLVAVVEALDPDQLQELGLADSRRIAERPSCLPETSATVKSLGELDL